MALADMINQTLKQEQDSQLRDSENRRRNTRLLLNEMGREVERIAGLRRDEPTNPLVRFLIRGLE